MPSPNPIKDPPGTLLRRTRHLLKQDKRSLFTIASESDLPFYWLRKFATGETKDPGVNRVQSLYEYLTNHKLIT